MQTILDPDNSFHWGFLAAWQEAASRHSLLIQWHHDNPRPDGWGEDVSDWVKRKSTFRAEVGLPDYPDPGQIVTVHGAYAMRMPRLYRDENDTPLYGDRVVQCRHCETLFATFDRNDYCCSEDCKQGAMQSTADAKAERRRNRQAKRSEALANRYGICLACGEQFTLKRITAKTCSEACRKRLQRNPALAQQHLQLPPLRTDLAELEAAVLSQAQQSLAAAIGVVRAGQRPPEEADAVKAERLQLKRTVWQQRCVQRLHAIADQAPALTAWLSQQGDDAVMAAFSPEYSGTILGPDLKARLGIDAYTDAEVSWSVRWGVV
jgi:hypothetical protein